MQPLGDGSPGFFNGLLDPTWSLSEKIIGSPLNRFQWIMTWIITDPTPQPLGFLGCFWDDLDGFTLFSNHLKDPILTIKF